VRAVAIEPTTMSPARILWLLPACFSACVTLFFALQCFARLQVAQGDTKGLEWLIPIARIRLYGGTMYETRIEDRVEDRERAWGPPAFAMAVGAFITVVVVQEALKQ
jgi:hypothetical protein